MSVISIAYVITLPIKKQRTYFTTRVNIDYCLPTRQLLLYITVWQFINEIELSSIDELRSIKLYKIRNICK